MTGFSVVPAYRNPPIDELAIGVQFPAIPKFLDIHSALYWQRVRDQYPRVESQPRLEGPIEGLDPSPVPVQFVPIDVRQVRNWLINETDDQLIQIQNSRFVYNWRHRETPYPKFEPLLGRFRVQFELFCDFLTEEGLERPLVQQIELTYINWVPDMPAKVFLKAAQPTTISTLGVDTEPDQQSWSARYSIGGGEQDLVRRLYVECQPAMRVKEPKEQGIQLSLVFRAARASGLSEQEVASLPEEGRQIAAQAFTDLTTAEAHKRWDRYK
jgi:uncharacterized protein (TIGR04255 family)